MLDSYSILKLKYLNEFRHLYSMKSNSGGSFTLPNSVCVYLFVYLCTCMKTRVQLWTSQSLSTFFFFPTVESLTSPVDDSFRRMGGQHASGITSCPCLTNTRVVGNAATLSFSPCALVIPTQVIMLAWWAFYLLFSQSLLPSSLCQDKLLLIVW